MRRALRRRAILLAWLILVGAAGSSMAASTSTPSSANGQKVCPICGRASDDQADYGTKAGSTLARGAANTLLGWTEIIRQPAQEVKEGGNVLTGVAHGVGNGVGRTLAGLGEVLTFWTPKMKTGYIHFANDCPVCMGKK